jgi:hypothetical protein
MGSKDRKGLNEIRVFISIRIKDKAFDYAV